MLDVTLPILHQLGTDIDDFVQRDSEVDELVTMLATGKHCAAISAIGGMGGVGKTTLATRVGHRLKATYPNAQIVLDMRGTKENWLKPEEAMAQIVRVFIPKAQLSDDSKEAVKEYRHLLSGKSALIILDDAKDAAQVKPLMVTGPSAFIITSRKKIVLPGVHSVDLDVLSEEKARDLLVSILGMERVDEEELKEIAKLCGYLPLALRVAGTFLSEWKDWSAKEYIGKLADEKKRLKELKQDDLDVEAVLSLSAKQLLRDDKGLAEMWQALSVFPKDFDRQAVTSTVWGEESSTKEALSKLTTQSLLMFDTEKGRYHLHDLMKPVARNVFSYGDGPANEEEDAERLRKAGFRHSLYFMNVLSKANMLYKKGHEAVMEGLALFDLERENIVAGQKWACAHAEDDENSASLCANYPNAGAYVLNLRLHMRDWIGWLESALASARKLKDRRIEGWHLGNLGLAYAALGDTRKAIDFYEQRLVIARETGDRRGEGNALGNLGLAYAALGETRKAIDFYEQQLEIVRKTGDRRGEGNALGNLGNAYAALGETRKAIDFYEQQLEIARETGDRRGEGNALGNLGNAYAALGETRKAIDFYEQVLEINRETGDRRGEGATLGNLGNAYLILGETRKAIKYYEQVLEINRETGDRRGEGNALGNLGLAYAALGDTRKAIDFYEQQLEIVRKTGDRRGEGNALWNMSLTLYQLGERDRAIENAEKALAIYEQIEDPNAERVRKQLAAWRGERSGG